MISKTTQVTNKLGFHARPVSLLMNCAKNYSSAITLSKGEQTTDMRSIVTLLKLKVKKGDMVTISADGPDEQEAVNKLTALIESKFGEE